MVEGNYSLGLLFAPQNLPDSTANYMKAEALFCFW